MSRIRVLVIDDSALMRKLLTGLLNADPDIEVVGVAMDAYAARSKIKRLNPDVLTLDVEMPRMDGVTFLSNLMRLRPMPVVMVSSLTTRGAALTMRALSLGAVDFVNKPKVDLESTLEDYSDEICAKVKAAARVCMDTLTEMARKAVLLPPPEAPEGHVLHSVGGNYRTTDQVIAIGASTGGTEAIKDVLTRLKPDCPGIVIAQHIPPVFSRTFSERMNQCSPLVVREATDGQQIRPGHAFIAPGGKHLEVTRDGAFYRTRITNEDPVNLHRPSVDVLFDSVAKNVGKNAIGVILTGMGKDGAKGLKRMRDAGAPTIAQDEETSVIWGMPGSAVKIGGVDDTLPLLQIGPKLLKMTQ